ncbi:hypothetical protein [Bartonella sp. F02]|uniref:hypothetical protein n=1 Tax=Bartonella sp. F02 TaxID=2967262 RepID=UPI0022A9A0AE|nr:hypothetical protein [Bartonella sp. F02]MCZ2328114.1 hypothetical protein [Bartonella sp. F02]
MLRPLFKLMTFIFITLTLISSVIDGAHSVAASHLVITSLNKIVAQLFQTDIYSFHQALYNLMPSLLASICIALTYLPAWLFFGALAIVFYILSYEKPKPFHNFHTQRRITHTTR